jgi:hypothetical protein
MNATTLSGLTPRKLLAALAATIALAVLWFVIYGQAYAQPRPHDVPVAVVGPPPAAAQLAVSLHEHSAFRVVPVTSEADALTLVQQRQADAIVNVFTRQLQTAQAASGLADLALTQIFAAHPGGLVLQHSELKPAAAHDPSGVALLLTVIALVLIGYPGGVLFALLSKTRRPKGIGDAALRTLLIVAFSGLSALLVALFCDPVLGYYSGQFLSLWAWGTLLCAVAMASGAALTAIGPAGAAFGLVVFITFGIASSSIPIPWNFQSGIYRVLGPFLPEGAAVNGVRDAIFFGTASQAQSLEVLAAWIVIPAAILLAFGWRSRTAVESHARAQPRPAAT